METLEKENILIVHIQQSGLEKETAQSLQKRFMPFFEKAEEWKAKANDLIVTDISQTREMKMAREARLALKDIRVNVEKERKNLKEDSLRKGKAIDGIANVLKSLIEPIEEHLDKQERFAEIQEQERKDKLKAEREIELQPFVEFIPLGADFANMSEEQYSTFLDGLMVQMQAKVAAEEKAEQERIAKEKAAEEEREKQRIENARLRKEAEERERVLQAERKKAEEEKAKLEAEAKRIKDIADAKLKAEKDKSDRLAAELKHEANLRERAKKEAEAELKAKELAEKKAKKAPDKTKLLALANSIQIIHYPEVSTPEAAVIMTEAKRMLKLIQQYLIKKSEEL